MRGRGLETKEKAPKKEKSTLTSYPQDISELGNDPEIVSLKITVFDLGRVRRINLTVVTMEAFFSLFQIPMKLSNCNTPGLLIHVPISGSD